MVALEVLKHIKKNVEHVVNFDESNFFIFVGGRIRLILSEAHIVSSVFKSLEI